MKIAFGMIVFEGDYVLRECLEQVYPFAEQILIAEGPVKYWQDKGRTTSTDGTNKILDGFPDPDDKIKVVRGQFPEKDDQCRAYMDLVHDDVDYIWNLDSDEVYSADNLTKTIQVLTDEQPTSVGMTSFSFYGGFDDYLTGFEFNTDNFLRIFKYTPGSTWKTHRPPTIQYPSDIIRKHIDSDTLFARHGICMHHYSYVFPTQVARKVGYYKACVSKQNCIDDYFEKIYLPWVKGDSNDRQRIEQRFQGVHEFKPSVRGPCFTTPFTGEHPESIAKNMLKLKDRYNTEVSFQKGFLLEDGLKRQDS